MSAKEKYLKTPLWFFLILPAFSMAQSPNHQIWTEYMLNYPFANSFNFENTFVYSSLLETPRWRSVDYNPQLEYALSQHFDFFVGSTFAFTAQTEDYNTFEIRPMIGTRIHVTPNQRILLRAYIRLEQRNFLNLDTDDWNKTLRPRVRVESLIPITKKSYFDDNLWYGILDAEWLFTKNDVDERFANRFRLRVGLGYRLSYSSRFELLYMNQQSKNGLDEKFSTTDNVFRVRYKQYLRKKKPTKMSGSGN